MTLTGRLCRFVRTRHEDDYFYLFDFHDFFSVGLGHISCISWMNREILSTCLGDLGGLIIIIIRKRRGS